MSAHMYRAAREVVAGDRICIGRAVCTVTDVYDDRGARVLGWRHGTRTGMLTVTPDFEIQVTSG